MQEPRKKYSRFFKNYALTLGRESSSLSKTERELGIYSGALEKWRQAQIKAEKANLAEKSVSMKTPTVKHLEKKIEKSNVKFEILKKAGHYLHKPKRQIFHFMAENDKIYSVRLMCETLHVHRTSYYKWKNQAFSEKQHRKALVKKEITSIFQTAKGCYGSPRITAALHNIGYKISASTVKKYMKELGLRSKLGN